MLAGCLGNETLVMFIEGRADAGAISQVEEHASRCDSCRQLLSSLARNGTPASHTPHATDAECALAPGARVGRYEITESIGAGGTGVVYAAHDPELGRVVAIKLLRAGSDARLQDRLRREAQAMARLAHPNVVAVHDVGAFDDRVFIAMEHVAGETLAQWSQMRRSHREILEAYCAAGRGLAAAHAAGIVHRDFKPDNVLIGSDGRVRVGDFGLARTAEATAGLRRIALAPGSPASDRTDPGLLLGTPYYMAPELYAGGEADARSDQFSFCVALYAALYGERPFDGTSIESLGANVRAGQLREPRSSVRVPRRIRAALRRGLAVDPAARFASLDDLLAALAPPPLRRARSALALLAVVAPLAWWLARSAAEPADERCTGAQAAFASVWSPAHRTPLITAFTANPMPYAPAALARVTSVLDGYAARWVHAHTEACRATRILGEQSEATLDLRMACFERRRQEAGALISSLAVADTRTVERSVSAALGLVDIAACGDLAALRQVVAQPADPATRSRLAALTSRVAEARASYALGAYRPGLELARAVSADARTLAYRPLEAEAAFVEGELQYELGDASASEAALERAAWAAEAGHHDEVAARARTKLVFVVGVEKTEFARALEIATRASAAIERLGGNPEIESRFERALGAVDYAQSKLDSAVAHFEKALALATRAFGADHIEAARALDNLGVAVSAQGHAERALEVHRRALAIYEREVGPDHPWTAREHHNLGNDYVNAADYPAAERELRRGLAIRESTLGLDHRDVATNLADLARALRAENHFEEALAFDRRSVAVGEKALGPDNPTLGLEILGFAITLARTGRYPEAQHQLARAEAIFTKAFGPDHVRVVSCRLVRSDILIAQHRWREAAAIVERALPVLEKAEDVGDAKTVAVLNLALASVELRRPRRAVELLEPLAPTAQQLPPASRGQLRFLLARALWDSGGDRRRARELARSARDEFVALGAAARDDVAQLERWLATHAGR